MIFKIWHLVSIRSSSYFTYCNKRTNILFLLDFIRPICLPLFNESSTVGETLYVAGWGKTEFVNLNPVKLKLGVPIAERSHCVTNFKSAGVDLNGSQICAGGEKGKDSCTGIVNIHQPIKIQIFCFSMLTNWFLLL